MKPSCFTYAIALLLVLWCQPFTMSQQMATQSPSVHYQVLHTFQGGADGALPSSLIGDAAGNLYGTAYEGGNSDCTYGPAGGCGVVFKLDKTGKESVLYRFKGGTDGAHPATGLLRDAAGNLYGTAEHGGELSCGSGGGLGCGVVFKLDTASRETVLYSFSGGADGAFPVGPLLRDEAGNLYGAAPLGGNLGCNVPFGCGVVFKVDTTGKQTVLHAFNGGDGQNPQAGLIADSSGNLYGTTFLGGDPVCLCGLVFKLDKSGKETVLHNFKAFHGGRDGAYPYADLLLDEQGNLYSTTYGGGFFDNGTVFKLDKAGKETVLYGFKSKSDGAAPYFAVIRDGTGNLYGTTFGGGPLGCGGPGCGAVFKLDASGKETTLHHFTGEADGGNPSTALVRDSVGNLYGATYTGAGTGCGGLGCGVVFKITPSPQRKQVHQERLVGGDQNFHTVVVPLNESGVTGTPSSIAKPSKSSTLTSST